MFCFFSLVVPNIVLSMHETDLLSGSNNFERHDGYLFEEVIFEKYMREGAGEAEYRLPRGFHARG